MLRNTSSPRKPCNNSDNVKMLRINWSTTSKVSCILRITNLLPEVLHLKAIKADRVKQFSMPK